MKIKLDGRTINCPQVHYDVFGNKFTMLDNGDNFEVTRIDENFWGVGEAEEYRKIWLSYLDNVRNMSFPLYTVKVNEVKFTKGFKIDAKTKR